MEDIHLLLFVGTNNPSPPLIHHLLCSELIKYKTIRILLFVSGWTDFNTHVAKDFPNYHVEQTVINNWDWERAFIV
jgi:hypothetical protein